MLVVDSDREVLVGATFTGPDTQELLHSATVAIAGPVPLPVLWHAVPSFPTVSEVWLRLLETYGRDLPRESWIHTPRTPPSTRATGTDA